MNLVISFQVMDLLLLTVWVKCHILLKSKSKLGVLMTYESDNTLKTGRSSFFLTFYPVQCHANLEPIPGSTRHLAGDRTGRQCTTGYIRQQFGQITT